MGSLGFEFLSLLAGLADCPYFTVELWRIFFSFVVEPVF
jgi:hypothetical protein